MDLRAPVSPVLRPVTGYQVSIPPGTTDVVIQLNGAEVLRISLGATMSIKSQNDLLFEAPNITLKAGNLVNIQAGTSIGLKAGSMMTLEGGLSLAVKAGSAISLRSGGSMTLDSAKVDLNNGALEVV